LAKKNIPLGEPKQASNGMANFGEQSMTTGDETLVGRLRHGDLQALGELFSGHRERLGRLVSFRLSPRLAGRVDVDDVLQESYLAAAARLEHFLANPAGSFFVWLRLVVLQTLTDLHRLHLGAQRRDAHREIELQAAPWSPATSACLAAQLLGNLTSPSQAAIRAERAGQLEVALEAMETIDREVLALRHFEELSNQETAEVLGIEPKAASIRYVRALKRLKDIMSTMSGLGGSETGRS
jgi:RNA polymerase sigma-70 factor (ECF subfamily)